MACDSRDGTGAEQEEEEEEEIVVEAEELGQLSPGAMQALENDNASEPGAAPDQYQTSEPRTPDYSEPHTSDYSDTESETAPQPPQEESTAGGGSPQVGVHSDTKDDKANPAVVGAFITPPPAGRGAVEDASPERTKEYY